MLDVITEQDITQLLFVALALGVLLLITGLSLLLNPRENLSEARSRRLKMMSEGKSTAEILAILKPAKKVGPLSRLPFIGPLPDKLRKAGWTMTAGSFLALCGGIAVAAGIVAFGLAGPAAVAPAALVLGVFGPVAVLNRAVAQRTDALTRQLPDALELLARGLRVGHPLNTSVQAVANEMADPIGSEFGIMFDQVSYGDDLTDAFNEFAERVDIEDVSYLSASIGIQHGTGGDLARVVEVLAKVIRNRIALRRKVKAISAEGRLTAWFLSAIPVLMFAFTMAVSPKYYSEVMEHTLFQPLAIAVIVLTVLNAVLLRKLVHFDV